MSRRNSAYNVPKICGNPYFTSCQINIAPAVSFHSTESLDKMGLGTAGGRHYDSHDHPASLTVMSALSDLPDGMHEGFFFLLELGCYVRLANHRLVGFCGLHYHGGQPPRPVREDADVPKWATRINIIWYPSDSIIKRDGVCALHTFPAVAANRFATLETSAHPSLNVAPTSSTSNDTSPPLSFLADGHACMEPADQIAFMAREFYTFMQTSLRSVPGAKLQFNQEQWMSSIQLYNPSSNTYDALSWPHGPDGTTGSRTGVLLESSQMYNDHIFSIPSKLKDMQLNDIPYGVPSRTYFTSTILPWLTHY